MMTLLGFGMMTKRHRVQTSKTNFEQIPVAIVKRIVERLPEHKEFEEHSADIEIHSSKVKPARVLAHSLRRKGH